MASRRSASETMLYLSKTARVRCPLIRTSGLRRDYSPISTGRLDEAVCARFGETMLKAPHAIQWLSDNRPQLSLRSHRSRREELSCRPSRATRAFREFPLDGQRPA